MKYSLTTITNKLRMLKSKIYMKLISHTIWMKSVINSQGIIIKSNPNTHYLSAYKNEEIYYWLYIPKWIYEYSINNKAVNCIDIGAAYGTLAIYTKKTLNCNMYCIDFTDEFISKSLIHDNKLNYEVCNIERDEISFNVKFDVVIFTEVLEHLNFNPAITLKKIRNLLKTDGVLYISTPDSRYWGKLTKYYDDYTMIPELDITKPIIDDHIYLYNIDEFKQVVSEAGFKISKINYSPGTLHRHINAELVLN